MSNRDLFTTWASLVGCLCDELEKTDAGVPCFCGPVTGAAPMPADSCLCAGGTKCGTAWVRLDQGWPSAQFPTPDTAVAGSCTSPLAWRFHVGVVRCQPGLDSQGRPPTADAMALVAQRLADDTAAAYRAATCCFPAGRGDVFLGGWFPVGNPDGLCAGGYWAVTVRSM